jgi:hypothetical protein
MLGCRARSSARQDAGATWPPSIAFTYAPRSTSSRLELRVVRVTTESPVQTDLRLGPQNGVRTTESPKCEGSEGRRWRSPGAHTTYVVGSEESSSGSKVNHSSASHSM